MQTKYPDVVSHVAGLVLGFEICGLGLGLQVFMCWARKEFGSSASTIAATQGRSVTSIPGTRDPIPQPVTPKTPKPWTLNPNKKSLYVMQIFLKG